MSPDIVLTVASSIGTTAFVVTYVQTAQRLGRKEGVLNGIGTALILGFLIWAGLTTWFGREISAAHLRELEQRMEQPCTPQAVKDHLAEAIKRGKITYFDLSTLEPLLDETSSRYDGLGAKVGAMGQCSPERGAGEPGNAK